LLLYSGYAVPFFFPLRLYDAYRHAIHKKGIVGRANFRLIFPHGHAFAIEGAALVLIVHQPPSLPQHLIDLIAGALFGILIEGGFDVPAV